MPATRTPRRYPLFARFSTRLSNAPEKEGVAEHRDRPLEGLSGTVVEVGAGNGLNLAHYPASVTQVHAIEPEPYLRQRAALAATTAPVAVSVVDGSADRIPLDDSSADAGVVSLVLCSVPDLPLHSPNFAA